MKKHGWLLNAGHVEVQPAPLCVWNQRKSPSSWQAEHWDEGERCTPSHQLSCLAMGLKVTAQRN